MFKEARKSYNSNGFLLQYKKRLQRTLISIAPSYYTYMLFTGWEVRIGKNCARGLEYGPRPQAEGHTQARGHSFSLYGPT